MAAGKLFHADAAERVKLAVSTWRDYYSDGRTPKPDGHVNDRGHRRPWWKAETLDAWASERKANPKKGGRPRLARTRAVEDRRRREGAAK